jgi:hypothetical protein
MLFVYFHWSKRLLDWYKMLMKSSMRPVAAFRKSSVQIWTFLSTNSKGVIKLQKIIVPPHSGIETIWQNQKLLMFTANNLLSKYSQCHHGG